MSASLFQKKLDHFLVEKDCKKNRAIFYCKKFETKVGLFFSAKRLKKKLVQFLLQKV